MGDDDNNNYQIIPVIAFNNFYFLKICVEWDFGF